MNKPDYYSVQCWVDGFGHDTFVLACFPTEMEAKEYCDKHNMAYRMEIKKEIGEKEYNEWYSNEEYIEGEAIIVPQYWDWFKSVFG